MMSDLIHFSVKPQTPCKITPPKTLIISSYSILSLQPKVLRAPVLALSSSSSASSSSSSSLISITTKEAEELRPSGKKVYNVEFKSMRDCKLGISRYPDFEYDAQGGYGFGTGECDSNGQILVSFDIRKLYIPPLTSGTTKFLGLPLPPPFRIDIEPQVFQGTINPESGKVELEFKAKFWFSAGPIYKAPPLEVETVLTTEESEGQLRKGKGQRMDRDGKCKLVGVATVDPINAAFMNTFLSLPTECLAILNATISLQESRLTSNYTTHEIISS